MLMELVRVWNVIMCCYYRFCKIYFILFQFVIWIYIILLFGVVYSIVYIHLILAFNYSICVYGFLIILFCLFFKMIFAYNVMLMI